MSNEPMAHDELTIEAHGLSKSYPRRNPDDPEFALQGLSLAIRPGEAVVLIGPNGAGKSTTLRLIAGLEKPSTGTVKVLGGAPDAMGVRRRIGYLADTSELYDFLDVAETLEFFGAAAHVSRQKRRARAERLIETFSLHYGKKRAKTFSAGMRRRLGIAAALMGQPDVLLLDEPVTGLDPEGLELFADVMCAEKARGATIVFSSHRMRHVEEICDDVVVLRRGNPVLQTNLEALRTAVGARALEVDGLDDTALANVVTAIEKEGGVVEAQRIPDAALRRYLLDDGGSTP